MRSVRGEVLRQAGGKLFQASVYTSLQGFNHRADGFFLDRLVVRVGTGPECRGRSGAVQIDLHGKAGRQLRCIHFVEREQVEQALYGL